MTEDSEVPEFARMMSAGESLNGPVEEMLASLPFLHVLRFHDSMYRTKEKHMQTWIQEE